MPNEVRDGLLNVLIQTGLHKDRDLPQVPLFLDLVKGDTAREPIALFMSRAVAIARPVAAPPGVPPDRVETLRRAFAATMRDPEFLTEAERLHLEIDPLSGEEVQGIVTAVLATPKPVINHIQATLGLPQN
jgi:tripartite-type tricarboxylate transporter receptor subunit TctC